MNNVFNNKKGVSFQNNPENLGLSYKTDLSTWYLRLFWKEKNDNRTESDMINIHVF